MADGTVPTQCREDSFGKLRIKSGSCHIHLKKPFSLLRGFFVLDYMAFLFKLHITNPPHQNFVRR